MASKFKFLNIQLTKRRVEAILNRAINDPNLKRKASEFSVERIQKVTRTGRSMVTGQKLKPLADSTKRIKESLKKFNTPSRFYRKGKSNLTFTGQLLDSLKAFEGKTGNRFEIRPTGDHKAIRGKGRKIVSPRRPNVDIAEDLAKGGRPFLGLDEKAIGQLKRITLRELRRSLQGAGLKK